ncbi:MAG: 2-hydroxyacyl-CoA dehydratase family protein [Victivallaceae bacterium]|nr:2-hydroxyacyl-CoA dehydratase family protein [Victivallaceae bacterium]
MNIETENRKLRTEYDAELASLRGRDDYSGELEYFLQVLAGGGRNTGKPFAGLACVQVPLELFDAFGFQPFRMRCGSPAMCRPAGDLPALACPVIKSCAGYFKCGEAPEKTCSLSVFPTTCDWTVKLPELLQLKTDEVHFMELPHLRKHERGLKRWLEEVYELKKLLEEKSGKKFSRRRLLASISKYAQAWGTLGRLIEARRQRKISGVWFVVIANAFLQDTVESWTEKVAALLDNYTRPRISGHPGVFLAGSPISFPNLKIMRLLENAGMEVVADELCTSERVLAGVPVCDDFSESGLLRALAEKYQSACHCPTFADNDRRVKNVLDTMRTHRLKGIVYHLLKGCHPYDIESLQFEKEIRKNGFHFIKIETDYSPEDEKQILVRLEAFRELL